MGQGRDLGKLTLVTILDELTLYRETEKWTLNPNRSCRGITDPLNAFHGQP